MKLNQREQVFVWVFVAVLGLTGFYLGVHEPVVARRAQLTASLSQLQSRLEIDRLNLRKGQSAAQGLTSQPPSHSPLQPLGPTGRAPSQSSQAPGPSGRVTGPSSQAPGRSGRVTADKRATALLLWYLSQAQEESGAQVRAISTRVGESGSTESQLMMELMVEAEFAVHLRFAQELEQIPLALEADGVKLAVGNPRRSTLEGVYWLILRYPSAETQTAEQKMEQSAARGRADPFAFEGVTGQ